MAIDVCNAFRECARPNTAREQAKRKLWSIVRFKVEGVGLERWFLKTLTNVTLSGNQPIGAKSTVLGEPSRNLIEIAFGIRRFMPNAGLYNAVAVGERLTFEDGFKIIPFFDRSNECVVGGEFYFQGFRFILYLSEEGLDNNFTFVDKDGTATSIPVPSITRKE